MSNNLLGNYTVNSRDEIIKDLWIGQQPLEPYDGISKFKFVINLTGMPYYNIKPWQTVVVAPFDDSASLPPEQFLKNLGKMAADFSDQGPTLVHCLAGINRSAMITVLALINKGYSAQAAIDLVRSIRGSMLLSNKTFVEYILTQGK